MGGTKVKVIPIRSRTGLTGDQLEMVELAYAYWLERFGVRYGSPEEDFYRAAREVGLWGVASNEATDGPFLVRRDRR